ncbi:MAG TPA: cytochrome c biogenesis protein ResB, partial [Candidatus Baltobacteraceae bacterium]|nr:cytochrome c biogenesis protein ResB [Candidatus Baltobacteraceae bacterium]
MAARVSSLYGDFVRTFGNVLFAVSLFVVWGLLTLVGVIVDQGKDAQTYFTAYAAPIARAILRLQFDNIYHSPWYVAIIGLILLSLTVCTFKRVIPARLPPLHPVKVDKIPLHEQFEVDGDPESVRKKIAESFAQRGWQIREKLFNGVEWTFADKHNWARRGVLIAHLGFVIIAAGTTLYWARGFSGETAVLTGQTVEIPETHALIRLNDFGYKIQPIMTKSGMVYQPIDYVSRVTVTGKDATPRQYTVRVNHPIDVDGTLYYQSSYGFAMHFVVTHHGKTVSNLPGHALFEGDSFQVPGTQRTIVYERFVPTVDKQSGMPSADPRVNAPGIVLSVTQNGSSLGEALLPLRGWIDLGDGWRLLPDRYVLFSGIQYRYDPGIPLVGIGAFVLLSGLI